MKKTNKHGTVVISDADKYSELTYNKEHEEHEHSHKEPIPETPPARKAYTVRFS
jgi:hypothetical protein